MNKPNEESTFLALIMSFRLLNWLAVSVSGYFFVSLSSRVFGTQSTSFLGVYFPQKYALAVLALATLFHLLILRYIVHDLDRAWRHLKKSSRIELYYRITGSSGLIVKGAERYKDNISNNDGFLFVRATNEDPPSLVHWVVFFLAVLACIRYEASFNFVWTSVSAFLLAMVNWQVGSSWLVALSDFGRDSKQSYYFDDENQRGPRYFGIISGPWHGMNNNIFVFAAVSLLDALLRGYRFVFIVLVLWFLIEIINLMIT